MPDFSRLAARLAAALVAACACAPSFAAPPHIMVVVMENTDYGSIIGSSDYPFHNQLASRYALLTNYYAVSHPSEPNYLALISGSTQGVSDDNYHQFNARTLADQLSGAGVTWRAYMQDMASGDLTSDAGQYAVKHNPFAFFTPVLNDPNKVANIVTYDQLGRDLANANGPAFMWVTPNLTNDEHDGTPQDGEAFLQSLVGQVTKSAWWGDGSHSALVITYDESASDDSGIGTAQPGGGHIYTVVVGPAGSRPLGSPINHYGLLRSIETAYGLPLLGAAANAANGDASALLPRGSDAAPASAGATTPPDIAIVAPAPGARVGASVRVAARLSDNVGVVRAQLYVDGRLLNTLGGSRMPGYSVTWSGMAPGWHHVQIKATDAAGNWRLSGVWVQR